MITVRKECQIEAESGYFLCGGVLGLSGRRHRVHPGVCEQCTPEKIKKMADFALGYKSRARRKKIRTLKRQVTGFAKSMTRWMASGFKIVPKEIKKEREICCTTCGNGKRCPYCGCFISIKSLLNSEKTCPANAPRNFWSVTGEMVSVIIPSRNEPADTLNKTIKSVRENATGPIEVIVIQDGNKTELTKPAREVIFEKVVGRRKGINEAAQKAKGKYLFILDGHCTMSYGWDTKLKCACDERAIAVSTITPLNAEMNEVLPGEYNFVYINDQYDEKWQKNRKIRKAIETMMGFTGCAWMIQKEYFWLLNGYDESLGHYGHDGPEWALKVWLNDNYPGRVVLRTDVVCGHIFGTNNRASLYAAPMISQQGYIKYMSEKYGNQIDVLRQQLAPKEKLPEEAPRETKEQKSIIRHRVSVMDKDAYREGFPAITCVMLYYGRKKLAEEAIQSFLAQTYPNKKLLIVNTHPDPVWFVEDFPDIIVYNVSDEEYGEIRKKYDYAFRLVETSWLVPWDDDDIFLPWHLESLASAIPQEPTIFPARVVYPLKFYSLKNEIKEVSGPMWMTSLFQVFDEGQRYIKCDANTTIHCDRQVNNLAWESFMVDPARYGIPFIYRWDTGEYHGSGHGHGEKSRESAKAERAKKNRTKMPEPMIPHWTRDYVADVWSFIQDKVPQEHNVRVGSRRIFTLTEDHLKLYPRKLQDVVYEVQKWQPVLIS